MIETSKSCMQRIRDIKRCIDINKIWIKIQASTSCKVVQIAILFSLNTVSQISKIFHWSIKWPIVKNVQAVTFRNQTWPPCMYNNKLLKTVCQILQIFHRNKSWKTLSNFQKYTTETFFGRPCTERFQAVMFQKQNMANRCRGLFFQHIYSYKATEL